MRRGAKAEWGREDTWRRWEGVLPDDLEDAGFKPEFAARILKGDWGRLFTGGERWRNAAVKHGPEIATKPTIRVGTVHAAKGMEADNVILSTSVTKRIYETQRADKDSYNEERRVEYVGVTRARRTLVLASDMTAQYRMRIPA
jgi:superfamily I DNA/RNA helicase